MNPRRSDCTPALLLLPLVLLGAYVGSYFALVRPGAYNDQSQVGNLDADYAFLGAHWGQIFTPVHFCDRRLRTNYWTSLLSPWYRDDGIQYFAPGPEFKLSREAAAQKASRAEAELQTASEE